MDVTESIMAEADELGSKRFRGCRFVDSKGYFSDYSKASFLLTLLVSRGTQM